MNATLPTSLRTCNYVDECYVACKITFYCSENTICPKNAQIWTSKISHFSSDNNCCLAVAKPTFFCKTLFSGARFPVRRVVLVKNPICIIIIIIIIVYYYHYYHYFFVTCCDPCLCWEIDMPSIAFCRRLRQVPPPPDGMPGMPGVGGMRGGQGWPWEYHGMRDNLHGTHMKKWELIGFTLSCGSFNGEHDGEQ